MKYKVLLVIVIALFINEAQASNVKSMSYGVIINMAGKQRMLSQRIGKAFLYKTLNLKPEQAEKDLNASITIFEENMRVLKDFSKSNSELDGSLTIEETQWFMYKKIAKQEATADHAKFLYEQSGLMLKSCQLYVESLVKFVNAQGIVVKDSKVKSETLSNLIVIAGQERMLSQRLTMQYAAVLLGLPESQDALTQSINDFNDKITMLQTSPANNTEIDDAISEVLLIWAEIRDGKDKFLTKSFSGERLYELSILLLSKMESVTAVYEKML